MVNVKFMVNQNYGKFYGFSEVTEFSFLQPLVTIKVK